MVMLIKEDKCVENATCGNNKGTNIQTNKQNEKHLTSALCATFYDYFYSFFFLLSKTKVLSQVGVVGGEKS